MNKALKSSRALWVRAGQERTCYEMLDVSLDNKENKEASLPAPGFILLH